MNGSIQADIVCVMQALLFAVHAVTESAENSTQIGRVRRFVLFPRTLEIYASVHMGIGMPRSGNMATDRPDEEAELDLLRIYAYIVDSLSAGTYIEFCRELLGAISVQLNAHRLHHLSTTFLCLLR